MKKWLVFCVAACSSLLLCACTAAPATSAISSGSNTTTAAAAIPVGLEYSVSDNEVYITGYIGTDKTVSVPTTIAGKPVSCIWMYAFQNTAVQHITLPSTVTKIDEYAFAGCQSLMSIHLGERLKVIESNAFMGCQALQDITLPTTLEEIGTKAFYRCSSLTKLTVPKNVRKTGIEAFYGCPIAELTFEEGTKVIGAYAAYWCEGKITQLTIPAGVEEIGEYSFGDSLEEVTFLGDAPSTLGKLPFNDQVTIYYNKNTKGWVDTPLRNGRYTLIAR